MSDDITLTLTEDEAEIVLSALEDDRDSYVEAAREAFAEGDKINGQTFGEAADRIKLVANRLKGMMSAM
ncbi:hypothetical protein [Glacieibacterium frigidum]|uniref:Uncharacterized protein n=1 Tax=Glacieibacterium frigidum TaxID=2593303 RepID=A0A552UHP7_9SPHN|nr:hypothetical protein [Glacieibacterium frigidum]TRW17711.1 hypothetical protein FMM06_06110 [Glacieibacterium frigidum]